MPGDNTKRLTPDQVDAIIEDRLDGMSVRATAAKHGVDKNTVDTRYRQWLDATSDERRERTETYRTEVLETLARLGRRALAAAETDEGLDAKLLTVGLNAAKERSRIAGFDAPKQVALATTPMTEAEALAILAEDADPA